MQDPILPFEQFWDIGKLLAAALAVGYVVLGYAWGGGLQALQVLMAMLVLVACIWFPDAMGSYIGYGMTSVGVTRESNPTVLYYAAWLVLLLPILLGPLAYLLLRE